MLRRRRKPLPPIAPTKPPVSPGEQEWVGLTLTELNAILYACSVAILSDQRRRDTPVQTERRVNNVIDDVIDVSMRLSRMAQRRRKA
jgi:hypothetical protein